MRDLPLVMMPLYHVLLKNAHADKIQMEEALEAEMTKGKASAIRGFVLVRPSLLTDGKVRGLGSIRVGAEMAPAVGYTISREDVGGWMFDALVTNGDREEFLGRKVSLTY